MEGIFLEKELEKEWAELVAAGSYIIYKMSKDGAVDFYFDSTDLFQCKEKFFKKRREGWVVAEKVAAGLNPHLPERTSDIKALELELLDWGYKKKSNS